VATGKEPSLAADETTLAKFGKVQPRLRPTRAVKPLLAAGEGLQADPRQIWQGWPYLQPMSAVEPLLAVGKGLQTLAVPYQRSMRLTSPRQPWARPLSPNLVRVDLA